MRKVWTFSPVVGLVAAFAILAAASAAADGNATRGRKAFVKCLMCHSSELDVHKTGPSLARIWGRKAGTVDGFGRYSEAIVASGVIWNRETLDRWLADPRAVIPGTLMRIRGIRNPAERRDIIAYLERIASEDTGHPKRTESRRSAAGMMGGSAPANLSNPLPEREVASIRYCPDTYEVTTVGGETFKFWEFNLRFKTDSSANGPPAGRPALLPSGMGGDRAFVIFHAPGEITPLIEAKC